MHRQSNGFEANRNKISIGTNNDYLLNAIWHCHEHGYNDILDAACNGADATDISAVYLCDLNEATAGFAVRIIDIPTFAYDVAVTATPYIVLEIDGVATTIYGNAQTCSYNDAKN